ncbi:MAG: N-methyl-L-tryptophan oxidase [Planctomycetaceae bacterium]|nr:N-methyl-L-tryptophan oxidase [Planctomycetaceae bacterium]
MNSYDAIILGTGGVGSAAAFHLARRGAKVLGLDRFPAGHDRGSSHGETRIIRQAYFEHPDYVPLLLRAYELWRELEEESGVDLLHQVGLLQIGPPEGAVVRGVLQSAQLHGLAVESLSPDEVERRWPGFRVPAGMTGVYEAAGGYLRVERCVLAHLAAAKVRGAEFRFGSAVVVRRSIRSCVEVVTEAGEAYQASKLIITAGPWAPALLADLPISLQPRRKHVYWFRADDKSYHQVSGCPTFLYELPGGVYYGFPRIDDLGVKVAEHSGGQVVADPLHDSRALDPADLGRVEAFLRAHLPGVSNSLQRHSVCYYTMSPDEQFIVDRDPRDQHTLFAAGLSGHGFKFTSVLGEALADLALGGKTDLPIEFLGVGRFAR